MQVLVVGAGVVGLGIARAVALAGHEVIVAEAESAIGTVTSSRHSEVIHAGLYYPTNSLRALHCPRSRRMLYDYCATRGVPHRKTGKIVVACNDSELEQLGKIYKQAQINGCENLELIDAAAVKNLEPEVFCVGAMNSPETGIIDSHSYMLALRGEIEDHGGMIALNTRIERLVQVPSRLGNPFRRRRNHRRRCRGQFRGARRAEARPRHRGLPAGARAEARAREGQLLQLCGPPGVQAAGLSDAGSRRARHPRRARSWGPHALRSGRRMDRAREL